MGPFKCPDCGTWWAGFEHRCLSSVNTTGTVTPWIGDPITPNTGGTYTLHCTCSVVTGGARMPNDRCPVHSVRVTYTTLVG